MIAIALAAVFFARQDPSPEVLVAPEGFAVDLVDSAPNLRWPSAVFCRADGSLLVAEDPMDMPGPSDQPLDRVWLYRWKEDGSFTRTLFADKLFASFGLEEIDGAVYVMNMPHLTVLRDVDGDGVAEDRRELLTDLGPVAPGVPGGFNDHIVSGLRYGMDGYLYVACGDKGVPLAHGTDGKTLTLRGGGVIRMRPDGSQLEIVARGLRNILDVAMDANGEMFTYDNTDDGLGWWTRITHIVPGGYYGYPWDYHDHPERFLAPMTDYGGGSPTGGLVKREGGWPAPYEGSLFFCEWGDQTLRRFQLERDGGTFKVAVMEEFLQPGKVKDFHPTDVCESPDGRFLYVSDWAFGGWTAKNETGRLWRVRLAKDDGHPPGGVDARVGKDATLAKRLASEGWRTRLLAQEEIIRTKDLVALNAALHADERSALHGLYAARELVPLLLDKESRASFNALLGIMAINKFNGSELRRACLSLKAALVAVSLPSNPELSTPQQDLVAGIVQLLAMEDDKDLAVRQDALHVLIAERDGKWADSPSARAAAWKAATQSPIARHAWRALASSSVKPEQFALFFEDGEPQALELLDAVEDVAIRMAETRRGALEVTPPRGPFEDLEACGIVALARGEKAGSNPHVRAKALHTLGMLARVCEPWDGKWWSIGPAAKPRPARTVDWRGTAIANSTLGLALSNPDASVRRSALAAVIEADDARFLENIRQRIIDEQERDLRKDLIEELGRSGNKDDAGLLARVARRSPDPAERLQGMRIGARLAPDEMMQTALALANDESTPPDLQSASLEMLSKIDTKKLLPLPILIHLVVTRCADSAPLVRRSACKLLAHLDPERALATLLSLTRDPDVHTVAFDVLASLADVRAARVYALALADQDPDVRSAARRVIARAKKELLPALESMVQRQEFNGAVVRELRGLYAGYQPILDWEIRGPCAADSAEGKLEFTRELADKSLASLEKFKPQHATSSRADGMIDLRALLSDKSNQTAYAFGECESNSERDVELHAGSDDQLMVWLNGVRVHEFDGARGFTAEVDHFKAHLLAGKNQLVLRIGQIGGDWSFALAVPEEGAGPMFESKLPAQPTAAEYAAFATEHPGDVARGDVVIHDMKRTLCLRCHAIAGVGEHVGPDLSGLGARYSRSEIMNSILSPSQRILDGYAAVSVLTKDDQLLFGQIKQDDASAIVLIDSTGTPITIARADVAEVRPSKLSAMPEGLCNTMTPAEFADLIAWLSRK